MVGPVGALLECLLEEPPKIRAVRKRDENPNQGVSSKQILAYVIYLIYTAACIFMNVVISATLGVKTTLMWTIAFGIELG